MLLVGRLKRARRRRAHRQPGDTQRHAKALTKPRARNCLDLVAMNAAADCDLTFTPVESAIGGTLIGLSAAVLLLGYGRLLGFSGILSRTGGALVRATLPDSWRALIIIGLVAGGAVTSTFTTFPSRTLDYPLAAYAVAGLVAGFGTACGSGCTSGHGICGLGRLSPRSLVAVCTFVTAAAATSTVVIARVDGGCDASVPWLAPLALPSDLRALVLGAGAPVGAMLTLFSVCAAALQPHTHPLVKPLGLDATSAAYARAISLLHGCLALSVGVTSGVGLVLGGMLEQPKV